VDESDAERELELVVPMLDELKPMPEELDVVDGQYRLVSPLVEVYGRAKPRERLHVGQRDRRRRKGMQLPD
jgi:hypothetical protein